ncbi:divergent polysaccharide deacteylase family protein [Pseudooceanicola aestuarii]|uniref:divergent polysaccharide deacteylase family protein n=1 Tax=Pseudooceanicola aestuarii TaxID=2697319 RepID=UPI0013D21B0D|nr:divergent polysaccharide deacetylase family protein [Pseudooceanicola aestuarii]
MARGFLSGIISGLFVSTATLGFISLNEPLPGGEVPQAPAPDQPAAGGAGDVGAVDARLPQATGAQPEQRDASRSVAPRPDGLGLDLDATRTAAVPETGQAETALAQEPSDSAAPGQAPAPDTPVQPAPQSAVPTAPRGDARPDVTTSAIAPTATAAASGPDPAGDGPAVPPTPSDDRGDSAGFPAGELSALATAPGVAAPQAALPSSPVEPVSPEAAPGAVGAADQPMAEDAQEVIRDTPEAAPESTEGETASDIATDPPEEASPTDNAGEAATPPPAVARAGGGGASLPGQPARRFTDAPADASGAGPVPPFIANSEPAEADDGRPRMAIVLIDDGPEGIGAEALGSFPYPLTFAVDVARPDAAEAMRAYRAAGFEVLALAGLPEGATAQDTEVAAQEWFRRMPQVVGVMESPDAGLQDSRDQNEQLARALSDAGYGLLLYPQGLDAGVKFASRLGVPSATVFRDLDANGQEATVVSRFLDHGAFKAGQEGGVVMVGRLRPETVSALLVWGLADRASRVALVPVSAVLRPEGRASASDAQGG